MIHWTHLKWVSYQNLWKFRDILEEYPNIGNFQNIENTKISENCIPKYQNFGKSTNPLNFSSHQLKHWTYWFPLVDLRLWFWPFTNFRFYFDREPNESGCPTRTCYMSWFTWLINFSNSKTVNTNKNSNK